MRNLQCGRGGTDGGSFIMSNLSTKYCLCSSASVVRDSLAKTEHRNSSIPGSRSGKKLTFICIHRI